MKIPSVRPPISPAIPHHSSVYYPSAYHEFNSYRGITDRITPHSLTGAVKYTSNNFWSPRISKEKKEKCRRQIVVGVEVRDLPSTHFLSGEQGLFALEKFSQFDIVGEYTGRVVDDDVSGHYVAALVSICCTP